MKDKFSILISPDQFIPHDLSLVSLIGNKEFINTVNTHVVALRSSQYLSPEEIRQIQLKRFHILVSHLLSVSQYWRDYFTVLGRVDSELLLEKNFFKLPILTRDVLDREKQSFALMNQDTSWPFFRRTSGSTSLPIRIGVDKREATIAYFSYLLRQDVFKDVDISKLLSRKFVACLGSSGLRYWMGDLLHTFPVSMREIENLNYRKKIHDDLKNMAPVILGGFASLVSKFCTTMFNDGNYDPSLFLAIKLGSEPLLDEERNNLRKLSGTSLINELNCTEVGTIGFECANNLNRFHLNAERIILEITDENGINLPNGEEGLMVVTALDRRITPIIRYDLGDIGKLVNEKCPCGINLPLFEFRGRRVDEFLLQNSKKIRAVQIYGSLMKVGLGGWAKQFQIIQNRIDHLLLLIVPRKKISDTDEIKIRLAIIELFNGERVNIEIKCVDVIPSGRGRKTSFFVPLSEFQEKN